MNLSFSRDDPRNTVLIAPDGRPLYHIETPTSFVGSGNTKIMNVSGRSMDIGMIEWHSWNDTVLLIGRRRVVPVSGGIFSSSEVFQAGDGRKYRWKIDGGCPLLVTDDQSLPVAIYRKAKGGIFSASRPASLDITPQGMHILDDIVTTFAWFEGKRKQKQGSRRNAGVLAALSS